MTHRENAQSRAANMGNGRPQHQETRSPRRRVLQLVGLLSLGAMLCVIFGSRRRPEPQVPVDAVMVPDGWADESVCQQCHKQAETFWSTGHARTLRPASAPRSLEFLKQFNAAELPAAAGTRVEMHDGAVWAVNHEGATTKKLPLDWCFGSGENAVTWTRTMTDSMGATDQLEFRWSWYRETEDFHLTPGHPDEPNDAFYGPFGEFFDGPKTRRCFSCHASYVPGDEGRIDEAQVMGGVTCQRCHGPR